MKFSFITSLLFHSLVIGFLLSSPTLLIWSSETTDLEVIEVSLVSIEEITPPPRIIKETLIKPKKEKITQEKIIGKKKSEKIKKATTVVSEFNPSNVPSKRNDDMPETMIAPPKRLESPTVAIKPKKQEKKVTPPKKNAPLEQPSSNDSESLKQQPEAALPKKRPKKALSLESVLKSIKQRDNNKITDKKNQKSSAPQEESEKPESTQKTSQSLVATSSANKSPTKSTRARLTPEDIQRLSNQLSSCWTIISSDRAINHTVRIRIGFDENLHVNKLEFLDEVEKGNDPSYRVAEEQAKSAIMSPSCQPLALPKNKISPSDKLILNFNPQLMMGNFQQ